MSDHMIEDLIEGSIRLLDKHFPADDRRVRDRIAALYRFQDIRAAGGLPISRRVLRGRRDRNLVGGK
ncbi:hypothetical protein [Nocardia noduli]|uniref:hypothetical protein n=1 Tax=Nocardia noduli TaxID=2815722 RepID=UPI001C247D7B|nr:hypothetical protein [Nocardia noduli]